MIPSSWDSVTVESYVPFQKTLSENPQSESEAYDLRIKRACLLANVDVDEVLNLPHKELMKVDDLLKKPIPTKIIKRFRLKGHLYQAHLDPRKYTAGEYMAVMNACKDKGAENIHRILFLVCRPINKVGSIITIPPDEVEQRINDFKELPVSIGYPIALFFWNLSKKLTDATLDYSTEILKKVKGEMEVAYSDAMDG